MGPCEVKVCRICFAMDCELHLLQEKIELYKGYEAITGLMLADEEDLPPYLCTDCAGQLMNCAHFRHRSLQAHLMLLDILKNHDRISVESIQTVVQTLYCDPDMEEAEPQRIGDNVNIEVKHEDITAEPIATDFLDEIKAECMSDDELVGDEAVAPFVVGTDDIIKVEVFDEASVNDNDDWKLRTGENGLDVSEQEEKLITVKIREETEIKRDLNQTERTEVKEKSVNAKLSSDVCGYENDNEKQLSHLKTHAENAVQYDTSECKTELNKTKCTNVHSGESHLCNVCGRILTSKQGLNNHMRSHCVYVCDVCKSSFRKKSVLANHMLLHFDEPYRCDICTESYRLKADLLRHMRGHTNNKPHRCQICEMSFCARSNLSRHMLLHTSEKRHACNVCKKTFHRRYYLKTHMLIHLGDRPYTCDVCQRTFRTKSALNNHSLTHSGIKQYSCDVCKKSFNRKFNLQNHLLLHDDNKPFECDLCDCSFRRKRYLKVHKLKHSGEKPYSCDVCEKKLRSKSNLLSHMRVHASTEP